MNEDAWEQVARETLRRALHCTDDDVEAAVESVADTVYFGHDVDREQVERMRQAVADLEYVTEVHLAELCEETEPWTDEDDRTLRGSRSTTPMGASDR